MEKRDNKSAYDSGIYDSHIINVLPYYTEYHGQVIDLVKTVGDPSPRWLDTGCGTGTLALRALQELPDIRFTLCDPSEKMLGEAKAKLQGKNMEFLNISSGELAFDQEYDVVTAIQCHHYYNLEEREHALRCCHRALKDSGIFVTFENIRMSTEESDAIMLKRWLRFLADHGNSPAEVEMQRNRRGVEVFPITVEQHIELLKKCGFRSVNVLWASYLQAGFWAIK